MSDETAWTFLLIAEGSSDRARISVILKLLATTVDWLEPATFYALRGVQPSEPYLSTKAIRQLHKVTFGERFNFGFGQGRGHGDRTSLELLLQVLEGNGFSSRNDVILIWCRDSDGDRDRDAAAREVLFASRTWRDRSFIAVASECGEAWIARGLDALEGWNDRRQEEVRRLGFDPVHHPELLSHKEDVPKSAKDLLKRLGVGSDEEARCLAQALRHVELGTDQTGLAALAEAIRRWLARATGERR
jgi:hypothetical protein